MPNLKKPLNVPRSLPGFIPPPWRARVNAEHLRKLINGCGEAQTLGSAPPDIFCELHGGVSG